MGFRSSWVAWQGMELRPTLEVMGLQVVEEVTVLEPGWYGVERGEHRIFCGSGADAMVQVDERLAFDLSSEGPTLFWMADDASMEGRVHLVDQGLEVWSVVYEGLRDDPVVEGEIPEIYATILAEQRALQDAEPDEVDHIYEVLHRLGHALTGFRHDEDEGTYLRLEDAGQGIAQIDRDDHVELCLTGDWERGAVIEVRALHGPITGSIVCARLDAEGLVEELDELESDRTFPATMPWQREIPLVGAGVLVVLEYDLDGDTATVQVGALRGG